MKQLIFQLLAFLLTGTLLKAENHFPADSIIILYNSDVPESKELAAYYAKQRNIPETQLVGLPMPDKGEIVRQEYQTLIEEPLREIFIQKNWWQLAPTQEGFKVAVNNKIRLIVTVRGVPYKIKPSGAPPTGDKQNKLMKSNEAAVDSELAALGIIGAPIDGPLSNKYFKSTERFSDAKLPFIMMAGRIDGPSYQLSKRLIDDAIETEKSGLWGMCYLDYAHKGSSYKMGDDWIENIEKENWHNGIPTTVDHNKQTYLTNYPMRDVSLYYGWYTTNANGAFLNPDFQLKKGSIAVHIHSFSASNMRNAKSNWVGPLVNKGAAGVLGNVYEPYLALSHHLDIFHDRLLKGHTLVEACYASSPALSWQGIVIGDPLYTPFKHLDGSGVIKEEDKVYRAMNVAWKKWGANPDELITKLRSAAAKKREARIYEACGLWFLYLDNMQTAAAFFNSAGKIYLSPNDEIRITLHAADMYRKLGKKEQALEILRSTLEQNKDEPAAESLKSLITILDPPPPPAAEPRKQ